MPLFDALKTHSEDLWSRYTHHDFCKQLATGDLPEASFRHYLVQDYIFLIHFSRAWALAVVKSDELEDMRLAARTVDALLNHEMALHVEYCKGWGISEQEMARAPEAPQNMLYTRFVLETGQRGDLLDLLVALAPCFLGYAEIGAWIAKDSATKLDGNPYRAWIEMYSEAEFQDVAAGAREQMNRVAGRRGMPGGQATNSSRWPSLLKTFQTATELEIGFWDMGLNPPRT